MEVDKEVINFDFAEKKYGREGEPIEIESNFFKINLKKDKIYHYAINIQFTDIIGDKKDRNVPQRNKLLQQKKIIDKSNFSIFDKFIMQEAKLFSSKPIYDGSKSVYSKTKINFEKSITVQVKQKVPEKKFPQTFDVTLTVPKINHIVDLSVLNEPNVQDAFNEIQALNTIFSCGFRKKKLVIGSNIFYKKADIADLSPDVRANVRFDLGQLKQGSFGHHQAVKMTEKGIQLNVDRSVIVFNKSGKIIPLIEEICTELRSRGGGRGRNDNREYVRINDRFQLGFKERKFLNEEFKNVVFESDHITFRPRNKIYCFTEKTVSEIFFDQKLQNGETIKVSVKNYFEKTYKDYCENKLNGGLNPNLPCIQVNKINPKFIPLEVCYIVDDQYSNKKLNPILQSEMTKKFSIQKPTQRFKESRDHIRNLIQLSRNDDFDFLNHFNLSLEQDCARAKGRILASPSLLFQSREKPTFDGQWKIEDKFFQPAAKIGRDWMVVNFSKVYKEPIRFAPKADLIDNFIRTFFKISSNFGLMFDKPCDVIYNENFDGLLDLEDAFADYLKNNKNLKLIIFFIPKNDDVYNKIKYLSELKFGVMTQCVSQDKQRNFSSPQYVSNLILKINAKLGGINFTLPPSHKIGFLKKKTMIMGLDVTHPSRHDKVANSVASVVATYDSKMINYISKCVIQPSPRLEIVKLDEIMFEMINNFYSINNFRPDFIIMYRDGVSESQFNEVINKELKLMKAAFSRIDPNYAPRLTFIVVQKRHHVRFLPSNPRNRLNSENVKPGTVIDNTIVSNYYHEFFLTAHYGALGTSRPTRYIVLHDESDFSGDEIQRATNNLSYLFPRCLKAVSIPPPVLYSHLAAKRARSYLITLDNNRGLIWGENPLEQNEIDDLIKKIKVTNNFEKILYYV